MKLKKLIAEVRKRAEASAIEGAMGRLPQERQHPTWEDWQEWIVQDVCRRVI